MARDRLATQELEGVLALLDEVSAHSEVPVPAEPPQKPRRRTPPRGAAPQKLFGAVRVEREDELRRAGVDDKLVILRQKVRALEERISDIRDAWMEREGELDDAVQTAQREKAHRQESEENIARLNAFMRSKKKEIEAYQHRVEKALHEQSRREKVLEQRVERAEQTLSELEVELAAAKRERDGLARRHEALESAHEVLMRDHAALEHERASSPPQPPPAVTITDVNDIGDAVTATARILSALMKTRVTGTLHVEPLRAALRLLRSAHDLVTALRSEMQNGR